MLFQSYKTALRNLFRSPLFWLTVLLVTGVSIYMASTRSYTYYDEALNDVILDTDPRFILDFKTYVQHVSNTCGAKSMVYALPLFAVITSSLILMRDYGDKFFEIERAAGIKPSHYVWGRVAALITVTDGSVKQAEDDLFLCLCGKGDADPPLTMHTDRCGQI